MKTLVAAAFLASLFIGSASAMPLGPAASAPNADIIEVAGGCGGGWHRGPYGGCRRNWAHPAAHACPRGYHIGPGGRCRGNGR
ncbi:GCG_CRPN prefix-to-repeats domain-containing protein [Nitrobacter sp.]|jgi:hypothetical protein|uniref:GCG_CRPN prefix-to-repeats domain-containing protein n=1 Tax=Nitrobacter sp. TaxID=29420 RepID=UPI003F651468